MTGNWNDAIAWDDAGTWDTAGGAYSLVLAAGSFSLSGVAAAFSRTVSSAFKVHLRRKKV